jgi:hypothetical protein
MEKFYYSINIILSIYSILIAVFGSIGNILTFSICMSKNLRKIPTFIFIGFMALIDILSLSMWNFNELLLTFYGLTIGDFNHLACKITSFLQLFSLQTSAFLLVSKPLTIKFRITIKKFYN